MILQEEYIIGQIYEHARRPKYQKSSRVYNFECPICNEGKSRGKRQRGYYIPAQNTVCCHNCNWKSNPINWIMQVSGKTFKEVASENNEFVGDADYMVQQREESPKKPTYGTLPEDSINLYAENEVKYFEDNPIIKNAIKYCQDRRLYTAVNRPKALYISLKDIIFKNELCFPFFNREEKIDFYQIRTLDPHNRIKYRGKTNGDKSIFNLNNIDIDYPYIFLFEGPIDCMFVKNGVAIAGTSLSDLQQQILQQFPFHKKIWCLDNQQQDKTSREITQKLIAKNESVFIWPKKLAHFKDINEVCCHYGVDQFGTKLIIENTVANKIEAIVKGLSV